MLKIVVCPKLLDKKLGKIYTQILHIGNQHKKKGFQKSCEKSIQLLD